MSNGKKPITRKLFIVFIRLSEMAQHGFINFYQLFKSSVVKMSNDHVDRLSNQWRI
jgi:hypothetical protein